jgi:hypothetical protein
VQTPETKIVWKTLLPDRAVAIKPLAGAGMVVLTEDGSLTALNGHGKVEWQKALSGGEVWLLDASTDGNLVVVGASQHMVGFDGKGKKLFDVPLTADKHVPQVTVLAVAPDGKRIAAGASNGKLVLFQPDGKRLWAVGGVNPNDKKAVPNPYLSGIFDGEGNTLVALTHNEVHVVNATDGKLIARAGGVSGLLEPQRSGRNVLVGDGNSVSVFLLGQNKMGGRTDLAKIGPASLAVAGEDVIIGGEIDGTVRKQKAGAEVKTKPVWEHKTPGRLVKQVAAHKDLTAVTYWGGLVRIFDATGAIKSAHGFPQDAAAVAWVGDQLIIGLADGRMMGMK